MATPASDAAAPVEPTPAANHHVIVPAPIATGDQHVCFICLQNDTDTPNATWVNPCPCSLEAHEGCMLQWIAEMETSGTRSKGGIKCPACKAPILIEQPFDRFLAIRDHVYRQYSLVSPYILAMVLTGGTVAGMASYGYAAASIFAGHDRVDRWLGVQSRGRIRLPAVPLAVFQLSFIGPGLLISRWAPWLAIPVSVPISSLYAAMLLAEENFPAWPPNPEWAFTAMPFVYLSYTCLFYDLFGPLERRLNRALRGQAPADEPAALEDEVREAAQAPEAAAGAQAAGHEGEPDGIMGTLATISRAIRDMFGGHVEGEVNIEVEVGDGVEFRIDDGGGEQDELDGERLGDGDVVEGEDEFQILQGRAGRQPAPEQARPAEEVEDQHQAVPPAAALPHPEAPRQNQRPARNNNNNNRNQRRNNNAAANPRDPGPLSNFINGLVSTLLLPAISYGMGELIRMVIPKSWATPPSRRPPNMLLQQLWGRSLVGGCLFVVLRDTLALYTKYRRVMVKLKRKVKNVEKKAGRGTAGGSA